MPKVKKKSKGKSQHVPYAKDFKVPTAEQQRLAISSKGNLNKELEPGEQFFENIPQPSSVDDWLAQYNEEGQTYDQFLDECPWLSRRRQKGMNKEDYIWRQTNIKEEYRGFVYLLPLGDCDEKDFGEKELCEFFDNLQEYGQEFLGLPVKVLPLIKLEVDGSRVFWVENENNETKQRRSGRKKKYLLESRFHGKDQFQLKVDCLLNRLKRALPSDGFCMIALTMTELYEAQSDLFVAGMAAGNDRVAVFSLLRYNPWLTFSKENWFDIKRTTSVAPTSHQMSLLLLRSCKLLVHEVCHLLGIDHCIFFACCMNGSGHLEEDYLQPMFLCPVDLRKLQTLVGFSIVERYNRMLRYFLKHNFKQEANWIERRLSFIQEDS